MAEADHRELRKQKKATKSGKPSANTPAETDYKDGRWPACVVRKDPKDTEYSTIPIEPLLGQEDIDQVSDEELYPTIGNSQSLVYAAEPGYNPAFDIEETFSQGGTEIDDEAMSCTSQGEPIDTDFLPTPIHSNTHSTTPPSNAKAADAPSNSYQSAPGPSPTQCDTFFSNSQQFLSNAVDSVPNWSVDPATHPFGAPQPAHHSLGDLSPSRATFMDAPNYVDPQVFEFDHGSEGTLTTYPLFNGPQNMPPLAHGVAQANLTDFTTHGSNIPCMASTSNIRHNMLGLQLNTTTTTELPTHSAPVAQENPPVRVTPTPAAPGTLTRASSCELAWSGPVQLSRQNSLGPGSFSSPCLPISSISHSPQPFMRSVSSPSPSENLGNTPARSTTPIRRGSALITTPIRPARTTSITRHGSGSNSPSTSRLGSPYLVQSGTPWGALSHPTPGPYRPRPLPPASPLVSGSSTSTLVHATGSAMSHENSTSSSPNSAASPEPTLVSSVPSAPVSLALAPAAPVDNPPQPVITTDDDWDSLDRDLPDQGFEPAPADPLPLPAPNPTSSSVLVPLLAPSADPVSFSATPTAALASANGTADLPGVNSHASTSTGNPTGPVLHQFTLLASSQNIHVLNRHAGQQQSQPPWPLTRPEMDAQGMDHIKHVMGARKTLGKTNADTASGQDLERVGAYPPKLQKYYQVMLLYMQWCLTARLPWAYNKAKLVERAVVFADEATKMKGAEFVDDKFSSMATNALPRMRGAPTKKVVEVVKKWLSLEGEGEVAVLIHQDRYLFPDDEKNPDDMFKVEILSDVIWEVEMLHEDKPEHIEELFEALSLPAEDDGSYLYVDLSPAASQGPSVGAIAFASIMLYHALMYIATPPNTRKPAFAE
ncbi:hypothetical protein FRC11_009449, partial [Ceratobasidium sp. 423]